MHFKLVAFALGLAVTATSAHAQSAAPQEQKYCIEFKDDTGSHVNRRECRTKKEWKRLGIDVDDLQSS